MTPSRNIHWKRNYRCKRSHLKCPFFIQSQHTNVTKSVKSIYGDTVHLRRLTTLPRRSPHNYLTHGRVSKLSKSELERPQNVIMPSTVVMRQPLSASQERDGWSKIPLTLKTTLWEPRTVDGPLQGREKVEPNKYCSQQKIKQTWGFQKNMMLVGGQSIIHDTSSAKKMKSRVCRLGSGIFMRKAHLNTRSQRGWLSRLRQVKSHLQGDQVNDYAVCRIV